MPATNPPGGLIISWNNVYLDLVRRVGGAPGPLAYIGGLMHLAMFETINLVSDGPYPRFTTVAPPTGPADATVAAAHAARQVLETLFPEYIKSSLGAQGGVASPFSSFQVATEAAALVATLPSSLSPLTDDVDKGSQTTGQKVAQALLAKYPMAAGLAAAVTPPFRFDLPGEWRPTGSGAPLTPQWGKLPLVVLPPRKPTQYQPSKAVIPENLRSYEALLASDLYTEQVQQVRRLGAVGSTRRTLDQTAVAFFWANDLNGTSKPPGQLYTITQAVAQQQGTLGSLSASDGTVALAGPPNPLLETARLFAMVGVAMLNAGILAWQVKYFWPTPDTPLRLWRPESAIRQANTDGNARLVSDRDWQPLSAMRSGLRFSPNFPAFISGHSTFGAAHAAAMETFYGTDDIAFTATTEDPHATRDVNGVPLPRYFESFSQAALENGRSRIYLGVHYQFDADGGYEIGTAVGQDTAQKFALPKPG
ncbi:vanadium-dependent haloperoxidase [Hymenobacter pini]|uniref:vanadium-dependent haloperoxidase n=1 Tax=Hymenobacter pini TaxID=2880879 RepID=UPI001CF3F025|nr:vanadium-dependent haloperoxidase [Hymenobacter pini]MCA8832370.1 vanadium-dependent haloperoxidase [Hymenobacter pini]